MSVAALFLSGVLAWSDIVGESAAWDVFLWYGRLVRVAEAIGRSGLTEKFANMTASVTTGWPWGAAPAVLLVVHFYAHYGLASITAHVTPMFTPFI